MQKHVCIILKVLKRLKYHRSSSLKRLHCVFFFFVTERTLMKESHDISQLATKLQTTTHTCNPACRWSLRTSVDNGIGPSPPPFDLCSNWDAANARAAVHLVDLSPMMAGRFGRRGCSHTWPPLKPTRSPLGRHHQRDTRTHELAVCCWIILDPAAHAFRAERELSSGSFTTRKSHEPKISQPVKSYSFETHGGFNDIWKSGIFQGLEHRIPFHDRWSWEHCWSSFPIDSACVPSLPSAASQFGMSSSVELSSASLYDSTTIMWCHEHHCGDCWWSSCKAPEPQYPKSAAWWFSSHAPMCGSWTPYCWCRRNLWWRCHRYWTFLTARGTSAHGHPGCSSWWRVPQSACTCLPCLMSSPWELTPPPPGNERPPMAGKGHTVDVSWLNASISSLAVLHQHHLAVLLTSRLHPRSPVACIEAGTSRSRSTRMSFRLWHCRSCHRELLSNVHDISEVVHPEAEDTMPAVSCQAEDTLTDIAFPHPRLAPTGDGAVHSMLVTSIGLRVQLEGFLDEGAYPLEQFSSTTWDLKSLQMAGFCCLGLSLAIDTTIVSALKRDCGVRRGGKLTRGVATTSIYLSCLESEVTRDRKVLETEVVSRWSRQTLQFLIALTQANCREAPFPLQGSAKVAWLRRWSQLSSRRHCGSICCLVAHWRYDIKKWTVPHCRWMICCGTYVIRQLVLIEAFDKLRNWLSFSREIKKDPAP